MKKCIQYKNMDENLHFVNNITSSLRRINRKLSLFSLINKAKIEFDNTNYATCEQILIQALDVSDTNPTILRGLGCLEQFKGNYDKSLKYFTKALEFSSNREIEYTLIGIIYYIQDKFDESIKYFDFAIELNDNYTDAYEWRNQAMLEKHVDILNLQERLRKYF